MLFLKHHHILAFSSEALGPGAQLSIAIGSVEVVEPQWLGALGARCQLRPPHRFHSGAVYVGQWCGNQRHGLGRQTWSETLGGWMGWFLFKDLQQKQLGKMDRWEGGQETCSILVR